MKYGVLGTGQVGKAIGSKLIELGHDVCMGSRSANNEGAGAWAAEAGERASTGTFADAGAFGEIVFLCVKGEHALAVIEAASSSLDGKVVADLTNPLDFSKGFPPRLSVCNDDSLGEQIQKAAPKAKIVKTFNTLSNTIMVDPGKLEQPTDVFVAGDDADAKKQVADTLVSFGHQTPVDVGGIEAARGLEAWLLLWTRLYGALGTGEFNIKLVRAKS